MPAGMCLGAAVLALVMIPHGAAERDDVRESLTDQLMMHRLVEVQEALEEVLQLLLSLPQVLLLHHFQHGIAEVCVRVTRVFGQGDALLHHSFGDSRWENVLIVRG